MKPTKFHSMKEYDNTKEDWKIVGITAVIVILFTAVCIVWAYSLYN